MKIPASKIALAGAALALACALATPILAADKEDAVAKKAKRDAEQLKKYDKNGNGKLDPDEEAALKADLAKAKAEKEKKKKEAPTK